MSTKKASKVGKFTFNKLGSKVHFGLWNGRGDNVLLGQAGSLKKAVDCAGLLKKGEGIEFTVKRVASGRRPHWYFEAIHAGKTKLGGAGGFASEAEVRAGIEAVRRCAATALLETEFTVLEAK
jgi:hypothetical protein